MHCRLLRVGGRLRLIVLLLGRHAFVVEFLVSLGLHFVKCRLSLVARERGLRLLQSCLERPRIESEEQIALPDKISLHKMNLLEFAFTCALIDTVE